jgi:hypothetical protein
VRVGLGMVARFSLGGRDMSDRLEQAVSIVSVDPFEAVNCTVAAPAMGRAPVDHPGLEQVVDCFLISIVATVADAADRGLDTGFEPSPDMVDRDVLHTAIAVLHQTTLADRPVITQRRLGCVEYEVRPCRARLRNTGRAKRIMMAAQTIHTHVTFAFDASDITVWVHIGLTNRIGNCRSARHKSDVAPERGYCWT